MIKNFHQTMAHTMAMAILAVTMLIIYYGSLNAPFIFDDIHKIANNPDIKKISHLSNKLIYKYDDSSTASTRNDPSRPVLYLTFTLNYFFSKLDTFYYRLTNLLFHLINALLIFFLAQKIFTGVPDREKKLYSYLTAFLFAIHAINTTAVTYIFKRSDLLATCFYLLALIFFIKACRKNKKIIVFSFLFFVLSLLSKQIAISFPLAILAHDWLIQQNGQFKKIWKNRHLHFGHWIILITYLLFRYLYFGELGDIEASTSKWKTIPYILLQPYAYLRYLGYLVLPIKQSIEHSILPIKSILEIKFIVPTVIFTLYVCTLVYQLHKFKESKSHSLKMVLFANLFFLLTLFPTNSFFPTTTIIDENRLYLPSFAFCLLIAFCYQKIMGLVNNIKIKSVLILIIGLHLSILAILSYKRNLLYNDPKLIWENVLKQYPNSYRAHNDLGILFLENNQYDKAIKKFKTVLAIHPGHHIGRLNLSVVHNNLGMIYQKQNDYDNAVIEYRKALEIRPNSPNVLNNLGLLDFKRGRINSSVDKYRKAIQFNPKHKDAYFNLGLLHHHQGNLDQSLKMYQKTVELDPLYLKSYLNMGLLYEKQKQGPLALKMYKKVLELRPNNIKAHFFLGRYYLRNKQFELSKIHLTKVIKLNNDSTYVKKSKLLLKEF